MREGKRIDTPHVQIFQYNRNDDKTVRFTAIAGKKVHKSAVKRHLYQRWLRAIAQPHLSQSKKPYDMVWLAKPSIGSVRSSTELEQSITPYLKNIS